MIWLSIEIGDKTYQNEKNIVSPNIVILVGSVNFSVCNIVAHTINAKVDPAIKYSWVDLIGAKE